MKKLNQSLQTLDYSRYHFTIRDWAVLAAKALFFFSLIGYLFYDTYWSILVLSPLIYPIYQLDKRRKIKQRHEQIGKQFKDAVVLLYSFIATGNTLERAFEKTAKDLLLSYDKNEDIVREFREICRKFSMNITIECCMEDYANRSRHEDVQSFFEVIMIAKRGGGSMTEIIKNSVEAIKNKIEIENEILTAISGKRNEFYMMVIIPAAVILYMRLFSTGFIDILYQGLTGNILMSVCLAVYGGAVLWGMKILEIHI